MAFVYTVKPGDTLVLIAKRNGLSSWRDIYFLPENAPFRAKRPNPDRIFPGDQMLIPVDPSGAAGPNPTPASAPATSTPLTVRSIWRRCRARRRGPWADALRSLTGGPSLRERPKST